MAEIYQWIDSPERDLDIEWAKHMLLLYIITASETFQTINRIIILYHNSIFQFHIIM